MIEMQYNFPLLPAQGEQWRARLAQAIASLSPTDGNTLRPTFRADHSAWRAVAANWLGVEPARTHITCGGHHGTLLAMMVGGVAGGPLAVERVTYTGALEQAKMLAAPLVACEFDDEGMMPESLDAACVAWRAKGSPIRAIYSMPTVHNPLGCVASLARREAIVAVARAHDLLIIEDDAYGYMAPDAPPNYAQLAPERAFYVRGLSKVYAPATRTGLLVAPERFAENIEIALKNTTTGTSLIHTIAALSLITDGTIERTIAAKLAEGTRRNAAARDVLGELAAPGVATAWHLWVRLPAGLDAPTAQRLCQERGVLVSGGQGFTVPGLPPAAGLRLALGGEIDAACTQQGVRLVAEVLRGV